MDIGSIDKVTHQSDTGNSSLIKHTPKRISPVQQREMEDAVSEMAAQGVVEKSNSPWSSAVVLVKKDGSRCFCVDYRAANKVTIMDAYPRVDDILDALVVTKWLSPLDWKSGFH